MLSLIVHNIRSLHNVGALFRTADAFGVEKLYLTGYTGVPPRAEIAKTALGSEHRVPWEQHQDVYSLIQTLKKQGVSLLGLELTPQSVSLEQWAGKAQTQHIALLLGSEVEGIAPDLLTQMDVVVQIPLVGAKRSLNVSVAAGIAMYTLSLRVIPA